MSHYGGYIDFHVHLFPEKLYAAILGWFDTNTSWRFKFRGDWREAVEFLEAKERLERYVCFGYAHKKGISRELNGFYSEVGRLSPKAIPLMTAHQDDDDLAGIAEEGFQLGLKGVKIHCQVQNASPADPRFDPLYERLIANGGFALLHAGNGPFSGPNVGFDKFEPLLTRYPELKVVVAHLGCMESERFLTEAAKRENLYLDTSYTFIDNPTNRMDAPLNLLVRAADKVLFATDFPGICHGYDEGVAAIAELPLPPVTLRAILRDNAARFLASCGVPVTP